VRHYRFVGSDEDGGSQRTSQRAERAIRQSELGERGNQTQPRMEAISRSTRSSVATNGSLQSTVRCA
jgi:hypothetical protein